MDGGLKTVGYALLVPFFEMGVGKTCGSFSELRKPKQELKCVIRFVPARSAVTYGMNLLTAIVRNYIGELIFNTLALAGAIKMSDRLIRELMGLG